MKCYSEWSVLPTLIFLYSSGEPVSTGLGIWALQDCALPTTGFALESCSTPDVYSLHLQKSSRGDINSNGKPTPSTIPQKQVKPKEQSAADDH